MKISQILDKIDANQLFVPAFQREYVWKRDDAKKLMDSLIKEYPTGTMLTWETNAPPELKGPHKYNDKQGAVKIILDGQQRITTLYMIIRGEIPPYYMAAEIIHDTRNLHVNVQNLDLQYYKTSLMQNNPLWVRLTDIFQETKRTKNIIRELRDNGDDVPDKLEDLIDDNVQKIRQILNREFIEQPIPTRATIKEAIDIFYIVNASGVNLTEAELALAQISGYWQEARELFKAKLKTLEADGFVFNLDFIVYVLLGVLHHAGSEMEKLHSSDNLQSMKYAWGKLEGNTLDFVMNLMKTHAYIDHTKEINSVYALIPIIVYAYNNDLSQEDIKKIVKWFYYSQIRQRYISQLAQRLDKDIGIVIRSESPFDELLSIIKAERSLEITADEFVGVDVRHSLFSLMRWYFKSRNAICLTTGLGIRQNMGSNYDLEHDHIFPYSVLKETGYGTQNRIQYALAQEISNRTVLTRLANRTKSNKLAEDYLANVEQHLPSALKLQSIPQDKELWKVENYESFLKERRRMLADELNAFLDGITKMEDTSIDISLEELIEQGESSELEFKSSMLWSYQGACVDKKLEQMVLKSIAAFSNGDGGTLLIGVGDTGEILGLDYDYEILKGSKDGFELHLRSIINTSFNVPFAINNVNVSFPVLVDHEICKVEVQRGDKPLYLEVPDSGGNKSVKFYVRSGNSSQEIPVKDIAPYVTSRFDHA